MKPLALLLPAALLAACQAAAPAPAPSAVGPTAAAIRFSTAAVGPVALAGGAVVVDPGVLCPAPALRVVGAGLPPGRVALALDPGGPAGEPVEVRRDGSFDRTLAAPAGAVAVVVTHDAAPTGPARVLVPACAPAPVAPGLVVAAARVVQ